MLEKPQQEWINSYYDFDVHTDDLAFLSQEDYERLGNHSSYSKAVLDAKAQYEANLKEQGSLLFHLRQLARQLYFNSNSGLGSEENAGIGVYDAIIHFNDYYSKLDKDNKNKIPAEVKKEIEVLLALSSDSTKNRNATTNLDTCIATRRTELEEAIKPAEQILGEIGLTTAKAQALSEEKKQHLATCQKEFTEAIEQARYHGSDPLALNLQLVQALHVDFSITSPNDLQALIKFNPSELASLCQDAAIQQQIVNQFHDIETLVLFVHETPIAKLKALLTACGQALAEEFIQQEDDFVTLLISLDTERCQLVCETMQPPQLIKIAYELREVLVPLSPEQCTVVCEAMKEKLPQLIQNANELREVLEPLSPAQCTVVCQAVKERLSEFIRNVDEFSTSLLNEEQRLSICKNCENMVFLHPLVVNVQRDFPKMDKLFDSSEGKKQFSTQLF